MNTKKPTLAEIKKIKRVIKRIYGKPLKTAKLTEAQQVYMEGRA